MTPRFSLSKQAPRILRAGDIEELSTLGALVLQEGVDRRVRFVGQGPRRQRRFTCGERTAPSRFDEAARPFSGRAGIGTAAYAHNELTRP